MPLLGVLSILIQIFCVVHVIRNGRDQRWMYFIVLVPGIGCAVYFIIEILPGLRHDRQLNRAKKGLFNVHCFNASAVYGQVYDIVCCHGRLIKLTSAYLP